MPTTVACLQLSSGDEVNANIAAVLALAEQAVAQGAAFLTLPENAFYMADPATAREDLPIFTSENHPGIQAMCEFARDRKVWVLIGSVAVVGQDADRRLNRAVLIDAEGKVAASYDKIHLFDVDLGGGERYAESSRIEPGEQAVLHDTPWGRLGLTICYDVRFPQLYRALAQAGAQMLAVPAAFTAVTGEAHWHVLLRARAIENGCFVIAPAQCGTHPGNRKTFGHSLIVDPWGKILAEAGTEPGIITATLDFSRVAEVRRNVPSLQHDRAFAPPAA